MGALKTIMGAVVASNLAFAAGAQNVPSYQQQNHDDAIRLGITLQNSCSGDLSDQKTAMNCFRTSAFEAYDLAVTTQQKIRNSGLPAGTTFPASHVIEYGCVKEAQELGKPYTFAGMADLRDRIVRVMDSCEDSLRTAETLSQRVRGDFAIVFNYDALNTIASHSEWLDGIRPELLDVPAEPDVPQVN